MYVDRRDELHLKDSAKYYKKRLDDTKAAFGYKKLADTTRVVGTWDDNDYGKNNAGRHFEDKE